MIKSFAKIIAIALMLLIAQIGLVTMVSADYEEDAHSDNDTSVVNTIEEINNASLTQYHSGDIEVINNIIRNNGWNAIENDPASWGRNVTWESRNGSLLRVTKLELGDKRLSNILDLRGLSYLKEINCRYNQLTGLDVRGLDNLQSIYCFGNEIEELDVSQFINLQNLACNYNQIKVLDVSRLVNLQSLGCSGNQLTELDVGNLVNLQRLDCSDNQLTELNVSNLVNLVNLECSGNQLKELDIIKLINLEELKCAENQLKELDISNHINLVEIDCSSNQLTELDVSGLTKLVDLKCDNNKLAALDLSMCPNIWYESRRNYGEGRVICHDNPLKSVKLIDDLSYNVNLSPGISVYLKDFYWEDYFWGLSEGITLLATSESGKPFKYWTLSTGEKITKNPYSFKIGKNIDLTPVFSGDEIMSVSPALKKVAATDITFDLGENVKDYQYAVIIPNSGKKTIWKRLSKNTVTGISLKAGYEILLSKYNEPDNILERLTILTTDISAPKAPTATVKSVSSGVAGATSLIFAKPYDGYQYQLNSIENAGVLEEAKWVSCPTGDTKPTASANGKAGDYIFIRAGVNTYYPASLPKKTVKAVISPEAPNVTVALEEPSNHKQGVSLYNVRITTPQNSTLSVKSLQYAIADKGASTDVLINTKTTKWKSISSDVIKNVNIPEGKTIFVRIKAKSPYGFSEAYEYKN